MSETPTRLLENRIEAIIERVRTLASERDALVLEVASLRSRIESIESKAQELRNRDLARLERENARLRSALEGAVRELSEEA